MGDALPGTRCQRAGAPGVEAPMGMKEDAKSKVDDAAAVVLANASMHARLNDDDEERRKRDGVTRPE